MMRLLVDTDVLVDVLMRREPFYEDALRLLEWGAVGEFELWMSSFQVPDLFHVLTEDGTPSGIAEGKRVLRELRRHVHVGAAGQPEIDRALLSQWEDFDDSCVHQAAVNLGASCIISRDSEGFALSSVPVYTPAAFFEWLSDERGFSYATISLEQV